MKLPNFCMPKRCFRVDACTHQQRLWKKKDVIRQIAIKSKISETKHQDCRVNIHLAWLDCKAG